jgi:hypothetical protein
MALAFGWIGESGATAFDATVRQLAGAPLNPLVHPVALVRLGPSVFSLDANAVERWNEDTQEFSVVAGSRAHRGGRDGVGTAARFDRPKGIATDGTDLYVSDTGNNTIRKVVVATGVVSTIAGSADRAGSRDGIGSAARFDQPWGIAFASSRLWITDRANFTVRRLVLSTGAVTTRAGVAGESALVDGVGAAARFADPRAIAARPGAVWLADGPWVRRLDPTTAAVSTLQKIRESGLKITSTGIGLGGGVLYIAIVTDDRDDTVESKVVSIPEAGGAIGDVPGSPYTDATGVAVDLDGARVTVTGYGTYYPSLYSVDVASGVAHDLAPFNETGFVDGSAHDARFAFVQDAALRGTTVFVVDEGNQAIRRVATGTGVVSTLADHLGLFLNGAAVSADTVYVGSGSTIKQVDTTTGAAEVFATLPSAVNDIALVGTDLYVVANNCALYRVPLATAAPALFAGAAGSCGSADGTGPAARFGGDPTCPACPPQGIATDGVALYVADHLSVRKVAISTAAVTTILPAGPPYDPQLDIAVAAGQVYVTRILSVYRLKTTGGQPVRVTTSDPFFDHVGTTPTVARNTYIPETSGVAVSPDGHHLYITNRTGVAVVEDPP